ncbi:hypothetical protein JCM19368_19340 [Halomonas shantousis]
MRAIVEILDIGSQASQQHAVVGNAGHYPLRLFGMFSQQFRLNIALLSQQLLKLTNARIELHRSDSLRSRRRI